MKSILGLVGIMALLIGCTQPSKSAAPTLDKSEAMQSQRQQFIEKMVREKIFGEIKLSAGNVPYVYVTDLWTLSDFKEKESVISVVYAFYFDGKRKTDFVRILDDRTHKEIGQYSLVDGGLKMNP